MTRRISARYDEKAAGRFWARRLQSTDPLSAVLTFDAPGELNQAYDNWERQSLLSLLVLPLAGKRALDLGAGTGRIALALAREGAHVTALDVSEGMLDYLGRQARKIRVASRIRCVRAPSDEIPSGNRQFDIVTCFGLLEHLPATVRRRTMLEAFRVLKRSGCLYVVVNNSNCVFLKGKYRLKRQAKGGYFVALVGLEWLQAVSEKHDMRLNVKASNPFCALVHYYLRPAREALFSSQRQFKSTCELAAKCDILGGLEHSVRNHLASHFLVEIRHSRSKRPV